MVDGRPAIAPGEHQLWLDGLDLTGYDNPPEWSLSVRAEETGWGNPTSVDTVIASLLGDGSLAQTDRYDNREGVSIRVRISSGDSHGLALGEAALMEQTGKRTTLRWTPPDGGPETVFDVLTSRLEHLFSGEDELLRRRTYRLTLTCLPFARTAETRTLQAPPIPPGAVITPTIEACDYSTTNPAGWSGSTNVFVNSPAGTCSVSGPGDGMRWMNRVGALDLAATPYLRITYSHTTNKAEQLIAALDGTYLSKIHTVARPPAGGIVERIATFRVPAARLSSLNLLVQSKFKGTGGLRIHHISASSHPPGVAASTKQQSRTVDIAGAARTEGSIALTAPAGNLLGDVLVYTAPEMPGYDPSCSARTFAEGTVVANTGAVTGSERQFPASAPTVYELPVESLPSGRYTVVARVRSNTTQLSGRVYAEARTRVDGTEVSAYREIDSTIVNINIGYGFRVVGQLTLPPVATPPGSTASVRLRVWTDVADMRLDETWLFHESGALTGTALKENSTRRMWIDAPSVDRPLPGVWRGASAGQVDAYAVASSEIFAWGQHALTPPRMMLFTVTTGTSDSLADLTYYPRFHTHAIEV